VRVFVDFLVEAFRDPDVPKCPRNPDGTLDESNQPPHVRAIAEAQRQAIEAARAAMGQAAGS
jgi:hypothetical protein